VPLLIGEVVLGEQNSYSTAGKQAYHFAGRVARSSGLGCRLLLALSAQCQCQNGFEFPKPNRLGGIACESDFLEVGIKVTQKKRIGWIKADQIRCDP
jgi:hypothetical protein